MTQKLPLNNYYELLLIMLAPAKNPQILSQLIAAAGQNQIQWEALLYQANLTMCTPLWYAQLKSDKLLSHLPNDLVAYLAAVYQANQERNNTLKEALINLLDRLNAASIDTLLIKGAATFCDQLFSEPGSRFMGDLDILVPLDKIEQSRKILEQLGYKEIPDKGMDLENLPTDERHHQLPRYYIPETPVVVEIHFKLSYALVGRMISAKTAWKSRTQTSLMNQKTSVLCAKHKLLLNAAHALIPHREYLRGSISPLQLTEFVLLAQRYSDSINWNNWLKNAQRFSLLDEFNTYLSLSSHYMNLSLPRTLELRNYSRFNEKRVLFTGNYHTAIKQNELSLTAKIKHYSYKLLYFIKLPAWMWHNPCYAPGTKNIPIRLFVCFKKLFNTSSWKKV